MAMTETMWVGKRVPMTKKQNVFDKVTGSAKYTVDLTLPGMLHVKILRSPYAHAQVLNVDAHRAEKRRGVRAVLTSKDVSDKLYGVLPPPHPQDKHTLPPVGGKVRYVGDPVAAVAADSVDAAEAALELIDVDYEVLPAVFDPQEAMKPDAPKIHPHSNFAMTSMNVEFGNIENGFKEADHIFTNTYRTSIQCHACAEPHASVVSWDPDGRVTVQAGTSGHFSTQFGLAMALGIPPDKIRVVTPPGGFGGGFGGKQPATSMNLGIAALLAKKAGRPVKLVFTREEEFACTHTRHSTVVELKTGVKKDGTLTARHSKAIYDTGAYANLGTLVIPCGLHSLALWRCPNVKYSGYLVYTNKPVAGAYRGFGNPQHTFAVELQNDEIIEELGLDPIAWRVKNHVRVGDVLIDKGMWAPGKPVGGNNWISTAYKVNTCGLDQCIVKGAERIGWKEKKRIPRQVKNLQARGIGMACGMHGSGQRPRPRFSGAYVELNAEGTINVITGGTDHGGTGQHTVMAQLCAEALGLHLDDITVTAEDTDVTPYDVGTAVGSGGTYTVGGAVMEAIADLKQKLLRHAAAILFKDVEDLEIKNGRVQVKGAPERGLSFVDIAKKARSTRSPHVEFRGESVCFLAAGSPPPFVADFAEVEVDVETGEVKVLKIVAAHDSGKAINPMVVEGQIQGGLHHGVGYALTEELIIDEKTGVPRNPGFIDYKVLNAVDMPEIEVILVETTEPTGPFGAKGVGEPGLICAAPAVANAIYNATGIRIRELPITAEKVLHALRKKHKNKRTFLHHQNKTTKA